MSFSKRNYVFAALSFAVMLVIFWFSSNDATASTEQSDFFINSFLSYLFDGEIPTWLSVLVRKCAHFTVYAALGFCLYYTFEGAISGVKTFVYSLLTAAVYAVSDEIHQHFVPGRACRIFDLFVDTCGAVAGIGIAVALLAIINSLKRKSCR